MTLGRTRAVGLQGLSGFVVDVEVDVSAGLPQFLVSGRPDASCKQAPDRVKAAAANCGHQVAQRRVTVNLSPASVPKIGSGFDLGICVAVLAASQEVDPGVVEDVVHLGELGLDGTVRPVRGVLPLVLAAARAGVRHVVVPVANAAEARLIQGVHVHPVAHLGELVERYRLLAAGVTPPEVPEPAYASPPTLEWPDLVDIVGQDEPRRALETAAAGGHHLYLVGPPGAGKTMLAERLPGLLPALDDEQAMEVTAVSSILGTPGELSALQRRPPLVAPHHGASMPAMVGGGTNPVLPGAVTQAHHGVLFLDEAPEFQAGVLQALRQPVESGLVVIGRAMGRFRFPCRFQLVLAANPCPCGMGYGKGDRCRCSSVRRSTYLNKLRGPLLDRVDIQVFVPAPSRASLVLEPGETSAVVAARVREARAIQAERWGQHGFRVNAHVPGPIFRQGSMRLSRRATHHLDAALDRGALSMRSYDRCLRLAWTLADLRGADLPDADDVGMAVGLRCQDGEAAA